MDQADLKNQLEEAFFEKPVEEAVPETAATEISTVKVGEKEYTQEELQRFVGLGEMASELESKWSTKIDRLMPEYTKTTQEKAELKRQLEAQKTAEVTQRQNQGEQLNPEDQDRLVRDQLKKYGVMFQEDFVPTYAQQRAAESLLDDVKKIAREASNEGKPKISEGDLLTFMDERGIKSPQDAYDIRFKQEIREWERKQIDTIKQPGLVTQSSSSAGSKQPAPVKVTRDNLKDVLSDHFGAS